MKRKCFVSVLIAVLIVFGRNIAFGQGSPGIAGEVAAAAEKSSAAAAEDSAVAVKDPAPVTGGSDISGEKNNAAGDDTDEPRENPDIVKDGSEGLKANLGIDGQDLNGVPVTEYEVYIDQNKLSSKGILYDNTVMLPLEEFFQALNMDVRLYEDSISITSFNTYIYIKKDCRIAFLNAVPYAVSAPVASFDGSYYFPVDLAVNMLNMSVSTDEASREINLGGKFDCGVESNLDSLFPASPVFCTIKKGFGLYSNIAAGLVGFCDGDIRAEILMDSSLLWYKVKTGEEQVFWVKRDALTIDTDYRLLSDIPSRNELEIYAVLKEFKSDTDFFVWVDISRQLVYVFSKNGKSWSLNRIMQCSTGENKSPTTRGLYKVSDRGEWFYSDIFESGAKNWVRFNGSYLFHSIAMDINQQIKDTTLGDRVSAGCIRLSLEDSQWFYENISSGTSVYVN